MEKSKQSSRALNLRTYKGVYRQKCNGRKMRKWWCRNLGELSMSFSCAPLLSVTCSLWPLVFPYFRQRIHQLCFQADKTVITALQTFTRFNRRPLCARRSVHECSFNELGHCSTLASSIQCSVLWLPNLIMAFNFHFVTCKFERWTFECNTNTNANSYLSLIVTILRSFEPPWMLLDVSDSLSVSLVVLWWWFYGNGFLAVVF